MMNPFDQAWVLLKMPKPDFPYAYDPDQFSITHDFIDYDPSQEEYMTDNDDYFYGGKILQVAANQGMEGLKGEDDVEPMKYGHASFYMDGDKLIPRTAFTRQIGGSEHEPLLPSVGLAQSTSHAG